MKADEIIKLVYRKDYESLKKLVANKVDLNCIDEDGRTPLMHAVLANDAEPEMISFLIKNGANPNLPDRSQKWTALHFAAREQKVAIVALLLEAGAVVDLGDSFGNTPLWRCVMEPVPKRELVRLLIDKGANPAKRNRHGASPKDVAERTGKVELLGILNT